MKLQSLENVEVLNNETINVIAGGSAQESKKKDVTSTSKDSASNDHFDAIQAR
ncbi:hypothetical protein [Tenacibaculum litopenaei]|jgi:hypothetical protein|uniref:hypothetical protein n=1 Tax=Tenacibaculum litopenaei TaxID=396016 RepID=UPI0038B4DBDA